MIWNVLAWWAVLLVLGQALLPCARRLAPAFPDEGAALAKPLALIGLAYASWLGGSAGLPAGAVLGLAVALLAILGVAGAWRWGTPPRRSRWLDEALFVGAFLLFAAVRALEPAIWGAEKYMDFALFNACLRAEGYPPEDPWLAGSPVNYYYFGYLLFANLARLSSVPPEIAYNLSLATIGAVLFTVATSIGRVVSRSLPWGLAAGGAAAVWGNLDGFLQVVVERRGFAHLDYWRSSRVVPNTINEFPFFSLLHGDLHPHVQALVILPPLFALGAAAWQEAAAGERSSVGAGRAAALVLCLAALSLTNPWDLPIALVVVGLLAASALWEPARPWRSILGATAAAGALAAAASLLALPFTLHFDAPFRGVGLVQTATTLPELVIVFGALMLPAAIVLGRSLHGRLPAEPAHRDLALALVGLAALILYLATGNTVVVLTAAVLALALVEIAAAARHPRALPLVFVAAALIALLACEVVYLRDAYGQALHRMNTVFKLYYEAWLLLALSLPFFARTVFDDLADRELVQAAAAAAGVCVVGASLCYPVAAVATRWGGAPFTLDGNRYLDRDHPDDAAAIRWLRENVRGRAVVLEATGDPYSYFARVSSNTGIPTVLGWANHEGVWRGHEPRLAERRRAVDLFYRTTDPEVARSILREHGVRLVFVGELEHEHYPSAGLAKLGAHPDLFREVFRSGATAVFEVAP